MATKGFSSTAFWAKQIMLALVLIVIASVLIYLNQQHNEESAEMGTEERSVSKGLSDFYSEFRSSSPSSLEVPTGDFVLDVNNADMPLDSRLQAMASELRPVKDSWVGEHKHRTFKAGNTLREAISAYAEKEGMQVIWDLHQDFVIKHQFQMDDTIVGSLGQIASAVDSNFAGQVSTFVCPHQRSLVVTDKTTDFLQTHCTRQ